MLLNKNNLELQEYCDKTGARAEIGGIYITPEETVATNSFMLVSVSTPKGDVKDFPQSSTPFNAKQVRTIIPAQLATNVAKKIKKNQTLPICENAVIKSFKGEEQITFATTDLEIWEETTGRVIKGDYPQYKNLIPTEEPKAKVNVDYKYLKSVITALARTSDSGRSISVELYGDDKPIVLRSKNDSQETLALVMPTKK